MWTTETDRGINIRLTLLLLALNISKTLADLMPPPVEPAQAPKIINATKRALEKAGHRLKSTVEKPVVVIMEET